jgi:hypothetical protein
MKMQHGSKGSKLVLINYEPGAANGEGSKPPLRGGFDTLPIFGGRTELDETSGGAA